MALSEKPFDICIIVDPEGYLKVENDPKSQRLGLCLIKPDWCSRCKVVVYLIVNYLIGNLQEVMSHYVCDKFDEFRSITH